MSAKGVVSKAKSKPTITLTAMGNATYVPNFLLASFTAREGLSPIWDHANRAGGRLVGGILPARGKVDHWHSFSATWNWTSPVSFVKPRSRFLVLILPIFSFRKMFHSINPKESQEPITKLYQLKSTSYDVATTYHAL